MKCKFCELVKNKEGIDINKDFIIWMDDKVPVIIFKKHIPFISEEQRAIVDELVMTTYPGKSLQADNNKAHYHRRLV